MKRAKLQTTHLENMCTPLEYIVPLSYYDEQKLVIAPMFLGWYSVVKWWKMCAGVLARCYPKWVISYNTSPSFLANNQSGFCYNCITLTSIMGWEKGLIRQPQVSIVPGC